MYVIQRIHLPYRSLTSDCSEHVWRQRSDVVRSAGKRTDAGAKVDNNGDAGNRLSATAAEWELVDHAEPSGRLGV